MVQNHFPPLILVKRAITTTNATIVMATFWKTNTKEKPLTQDITAWIAIGANQPAVWMRNGKIPKNRMQNHFPLRLLRTNVSAAFLWIKRTATLSVMSACSVNVVAIEVVFVISLTAFIVIFAMKNVMNPNMVGANANVRCVGSIFLWKKEKNP